MNLQEELLKLSPDHYAINATVALLVEKLIGTTSSSILNIGIPSNSLHHFLPSQLKVTYLHQEAFPQKNSEVKHIQGNVNQLPFEAASFDMVIACDVVDYFPAADRPKIVTELCRVSKNLVIIGAPFYKNYTENIENVIRQQFLENAGIPHPSLSLHHRLGLPDEREVEKFLQTQGYNFMKIGQGNMTTWTIQQFFHAMKQGESGTEHLTAFTEYLNQHLFELGNYHEPTYRTFFCIAKSENIPSTEIKKHIADHSNFSIKTLTYLFKIAFGESRKMLNRRKKQLSLLADQMLLAQQKLKVLNLEKAASIVLEDQIKTLKSELEQKLNEVEKLQSNLNNLKSTLTELQKEKSLLQQNFTELQTFTDQLKTEMNQQQIQYEAVKTHALKQAEYLEKRNTMLETKEQEIITLNAKIAQQEGVILTMESSFFWKIRNFFFRSKNFLPEGSKKSIKPSNTLSSGISVAETLKNFAYQPIISMVMPVYNIEERWLIKAVESLQAQLYTRWELCICEDASTNENLKPLLEKFRQQDSRIKITYHQKNAGIVKTSNDALKLAKGAYVGFMDDDDELTPDALLEVVKVLQVKKYDLIYTDEDKLNEEGKPSEPFLKPDWSPELLLSMNYIGHFTVYRRKMLNDIGNFRENLEGAQDYDLALRCSEKTNQIIHIPKILYHWRQREGSTSLSIDAKPYVLTASLRALQDTLKRRQIPGEAIEDSIPGTYRIKQHLKNNPLVSIIIIFKDGKALLEKCLDNILNRSTYTNYEIILIDTGSELFTTIDYLQSLQSRPKIKIFSFTESSNPSACINFAVHQTTGEMLVFLKNNIEIISPDWLESLLEQLSRPEIFAVNARAEDISNDTSVSNFECNNNQKNRDRTSLAFTEVVRNDYRLNFECCMIRKTLAASIEKFLPYFLNSINEKQQELGHRLSELTIIYTPYVSYRYLIKP